MLKPTYVVLFALKKKSLIIHFYQIKSNLSLYSLHYAEACNELAGPISASLRPGNTAPFEEMLQRWRAVGNTVSDLTGPRFEPQTSRSRDERVTARPTGRLSIFMSFIIQDHYVLMGNQTIVITRNHLRIFTNGFITTSTITSSSRVFSEDGT